MEPATIISVIILSLWALVATGRALFLSAKQKQTRGRLYIANRVSEEKTELYFEAYEGPVNWKHAKQITIDIEYKEL